MHSNHHSPPSSNEVQMRTNAADHSRRTSLAWSAAFRAAGLSLFGLFAWLLLDAADGPAWRAVSLVAILALAALVGVAWYLPRARDEGRWRAALDRYADQEQAKRSEAAGARAIDTDAPSLAAGGGASPG